MVLPSTSGCGSMSVKLGVRLTTKPSRFSKPVQSPAVAARRSVLRRIRRQELRKLKALLPSARRTGADELAIVQEAVRYIDQLHSTILARLYSGTLSFESVSQRLHPFTMEQIQRRLSHRDDADEREDTPATDAGQGRQRVLKKFILC